MSEPTARFSLRLKLGLLAAALALVPLPAVGLFVLDRAEGALEEEIGEAQLAIADDVGASLESQLTRVEDGLDVVGRMLMSERLDEDTAVQAAMHAVEGVEALDHVAIYDGEGALVDVVRESGASPPRLPDTLPVDLRTRAGEAGVAIGSAQPGDVAARLTVVVPMRSAPTAPPNAFAASSVSLEPLQSYVTRVADRRLRHDSGAILVLDASGHAVADSNGMEGEPVRDVSDHPLVEGLEPGQLTAMFSRQSTYPRGETTLGTIASVPSRGWAVVVEVPTRVALAKIATLRTGVWIATAVVALLALLAGLLVARSITRPIATLVGLAERLGRRELGATVDVRTSDELSTLGAALSRASLDLEASEARIREEEAIRADLGRYLPGEIVDRVVAREQDMHLGGSRRRITVLFADVVNFTPLTERSEPEQVVAILNDLFTILTEIVFRHGGTVDKFIGDCVMALWNAPEEQPDHAARALAAAEDMVRWLETGNETWKAKYGVTVQLAIGVHTGDAVVGNVGSETRMAYTAIGDVVNVAARLEAIARPQQILVTRETRDEVGDEFDLIDRGERQLAGKGEPVHLFEVRG